jgi:hypothetical protein
MCAIRPPTAHAKWPGLAPGRYERAVALLRLALTASAVSQSTAIRR